MLRVYTIKGATIDANKEALAYFSQSDQNRIVRTTFQAAGDFWIKAWLPMRFSTYAYSLGYYVSRAWRATKQKILGQAIPFLGFTPEGGGLGKPPPKKRFVTTPLQANGEKMITAAMRGARAVGFAYGKGGDARVDILIPIGHPVQPNTIRAFTTVPQNEVATMAGAGARTMASLLDGAQPRNFGREGAPSRTLLGAQLPLRRLGVQPRASVRKVA